ncbi:MAG: hypothetical protein AAGA60_30940 [Cyanobacteria bacterium P01_E01_bin.42]
MQIGDLSFNASAEQQLLIAAFVQETIQREVSKAIAKAKGFEIGDLKFGLWLEPDDDWRLLNGDTLQRSDFLDFWEWANDWNNGVESWGDLFGIDETSVTLPNESDFVRIANGSRRVGTFQEDGVKRHKHRIERDGAYTHTGQYNIRGSNPSAGQAFETEETGGDENLVKNRAYQLAIRVKL